MEKIITKIKTYEDIIKLNRESLGNKALLSEDRMKEHQTILFKTFIKKDEVVYFKMRELDLSTKSAFSNYVLSTNLVLLLLNRITEPKKSYKKDLIN